MAVEGQVFGKDGSPGCGAARTLVSRHSNQGGQEVTLRSSLQSPYRGNT